MFMVAGRFRFTTNIPPQSCLSRCSTISLYNFFILMIIYGSSSISSIVLVYCRCTMRTSKTCSLLGVVTYQSERMASRALLCLDCLCVSQTRQKSSYRCLRGAIKTEHSTLQMPTLSPLDLMPSSRLVIFCIFCINSGVINPEWQQCLR